MSKLPNVSSLAVAAPVDQPNFISEAIRSTAGVYDTCTYLFAALAAVKVASVALLIIYVFLLFS
ncbi:hypothetical protein OEG92_02375 [Polaribacter sejongensis]|uniref:hypothetical protein n=1 Tax=Polaribacter sejongensis TaxID=985043 RepID=UPI0035A593D5